MNRRPFDEELPPELRARIERQAAPALFRLRGRHTGPGRGWLAGFVAAAGLAAVLLVWSTRTHDVRNEAPGNLSMALELEMFEEIELLREMDNLKSADLLEKAGDPERWRKKKS